MTDKNPLLSDFLEELKVHCNGANLNKYIAIFYNGKVNGKTPVKVFKGTFDQFLDMLDDEY